MSNIQKRKLSYREASKLFCSYHGHGNGAQFLSGEKIQKLRVSAVVLLFGCSSVMLDSLGPQVEMFGQHYVYLIACSPCVVGMLWTVTDFDTDAVTTEFLSQWIRSSKAAHHWKYVNKGQWQAGGEGELRFFIDSYFGVFDFLLWCGDCSGKLNEAQF